MNKRDLLTASLLVVVLVATLAPFAGLGIDRHHDGIMLKPALDVLSGQVLYRDTFMQYGALSCYLQVFALWIQPTLLSLRFLTVAAYSVSLVLLYASWRQILPRSLTILSCGLFIFFIPCYEKNTIGQFWVLFPWSSVFAVMFQSLGLYALFAIIKGRQPQLWGLVLGMTCACVFWCRQPVDAMTGTLPIIWLALRWTKWSPGNESGRPILFRIVGGFAGVSALMLATVVISGAVPEWWYQNFIWPRKWAQHTSGYTTWAEVFSVFLHPIAGVNLLLLCLAVAAPALIKRSRPNLSFRAHIIYFPGLGGVLTWQYDWTLQVLAWREGGWTVLLPLVLLLQAISSIFSIFADQGTPKTTEYYLVATLAALSLGSLLQYFPVPDPWHILWSLAPGFGLVIFGFWRWTRCSAPVVAVAIATAFLPSLFAKIQLARESLDRPLVTLNHPAVLRGMKVPPKQARAIGQITDTLDRIFRYRSDIPSALIGHDALFLCLNPNLANPSPYFVTWYGLTEDTDETKRWAYVQRVRPLIFVHNLKWEAVDAFYRQINYVPLRHLPDEWLEIAIPKELADAMGHTANGPRPEPWANQ